MLAAASWAETHHLIANEQQKLQNFSWDAVQMMVAMIWSTQFCMREPHMPSNDEDFKIAHEVSLASNCSSKVTNKRGVSTGDAQGCTRKLGGSQSQCWHQCNDAKSMIKKRKSEKDDKNRNGHDVQVCQEE
jgi:hypothetical protein